MSNKPTEAKPGSKTDEQRSDRHSRRPPFQFSPAVVHQMMYGIPQGLTLFSGVSEGSVELFSSDIGGISDLGCHAGAQLLSICGLWT